MVGQDRFATSTRLVRTAPKPISLELMTMSLLDHALMCAGGPVLMLLFSVLRTNFLSSTI